MQTCNWKPVHWNDEKMLLFKSDDAGQTINNNLSQRKSSKGAHVLSRMWAANDVCIITNYPLYERAHTHPCVRACQKRVHTC